MLAIMQLRLRQSLVKFKPQNICYKRSYVSESGPNEFRDRLHAASVALDAPNFSLSLRSLASLKNNNISIEEILPLLSEELIIRLSHRTIADTLWGLGKLGLDTNNSRHEKCCHSLLVQFYKTDRLNARQLNASLTGIVNSNCSVNNLPPEMIDNFMEKLSAVCQDLDDRQLSNILFSLSKLELKWSNLPPKLQADLGSSVAIHSQAFISLGGVLTLRALGDMSFDINTCDQLLGSRICAMAERILDAQLTRSSSNEDLDRDLMEVFKGLAAIGAKYNAMPPLLQRSLVASLDSLLLSCDSSAQAQGIESMGSLGLCWASLQFDSRKVVKNVLLEQAKTMNVKDIASVLCGVSQLGVRMVDLTPAMQKSVQYLVYLVVQENTLGLTIKSLEALVLIGFQWTDLVTKLTSRLVAVIRENSKNPRIRICLESMGKLVDS